MHAQKSISSSVQYSYSCHYFSPCCRRFWLSFSLPHACDLLLLAPLLYDPFIPFLRFRVGPSAAVSRTNGPGFSDFDSFPLLLISASYFTCMTFSLFYATTPPLHPRVLLERRPICRSRMISSLAIIGSCSRPPLALAFFGFRLSYDLTLCFETLRPSVTSSHPSSPFPIIIPVLCVSRVSLFILRAQLCMFFIGMKPNKKFLQAFHYQSAPLLDFTHIPRC